MIDIKRIVEDRDKVQTGLLKRLSKEEFDLDNIVQIYEKKKELQQKFDAKRSQQNQYNDKMASLENGSEEFKELVGKLKETSLDRQLFCDFMLKNTPSYIKLQKHLINLNLKITKQVQRTGLNMMSK